MKKSLVFTFVCLLQPIFCLSAWGCSKAPFDAKKDLPRYDLVVVGEVIDVTPKRYSLTPQFQSMLGRKNTYYSIGKLKVSDVLMASKKIEALYGTSDVEKVIPLLFIDIENSSPLSGSECPEHRVERGQQGIWLLDRSSPFDGGYFVLDHLEEKKLKEIKNVLKEKSEG